MVGALAAVRGCSGRCVVDDETAAAQECLSRYVWKSADQPRCEDARPVHVSRFRIMSPIMGAGW